MNTDLARHVLQALVDQGVSEFCLCPGARNAPLTYLLAQDSLIKTYYWPEERSAAFFALGRIKATNCPVAVITTSGTAAAELLPAAMEAHYTGLPLVLVTADRPRRFRGSGAPQCAEQLGLFGCYAHAMQDIEGEEICNFNDWGKSGPLHLNICFEEPQKSALNDKPMIWKEPPTRVEYSGLEINLEEWQHFSQHVHYPLVIIGALKDQSERELVIAFLQHLKAPFYAEAVSGLREEKSLDPWRIFQLENVWRESRQFDYPIDGIVRLGTIPTTRLWRDLEELEGQVRVFSACDLPFSGLSWIRNLPIPLTAFIKKALILPSIALANSQSWQIANQRMHSQLQQLILNEPLAEPSLIHALSLKMEKRAKLYLGNSLPIREWDLAATYEAREYQLCASRGLNGIDGQIATFLGWSTPEQPNWALIGDLTALYDLVAPWIFPQLSQMNVNVVIVNNGGAGIFKRMFAHPAFANAHQLNFKPLAELWGWTYERWEEIPDRIPVCQGARFIELIPNQEATERFWRVFKT